jgi:hypothetical protein
MGHREYEFDVNPLSSLIKYEEYLDKIIEINDSL